MGGNTFGKVFSFTSFGESHGVAIGGIIDGCPSGVNLDIDFIQSELDRRKPGQSEITTSRQESDKVEFLSGIYKGKTTGTPIGFLIRNIDQKSKDYNELKDILRPSHADFTYQHKYSIRDHRGGGRASARETACRVVAGAVAKLVLNDFNIEIMAYVSQIGTINPIINTDILTVENIEKSIVRCPDIKATKEILKELKLIQENGDSVGGIIACNIKNCPIGLGEPIFDKLQADLAKAMLSINAAKGFEYGSGFQSVEKKGSELNDEFETVDGQIVTKTNHSGGIQGGISNGSDIYFNVVFKPIASIAKKQNTVSKSGESVEIKIQGRHDPCVVPRAVPIVEAMSALVLVDHLLRYQAYSRVK